MAETPDQFPEQDEQLDAETLAIRTLNDQLRTTFSGGQVLLTPGVNALKGDTMQRVIDGERVMFKVDAYDKNHEYGSPDPADPLVTARVLTILLASEY
jgi:hypothetical protein